MERAVERRGRPSIRRCRRRQERRWARWSTSCEALRGKMIQAAKRRDETLRRQFIRAQAQTFPPRPPAGTHAVGRLFPEPVWTGVDRAADGGAADRSRAALGARDLIAAAAGFQLPTPKASLRGFSSKAGSTSARLCIHGWEPEVGGPALRRLHRRLQRLFRSGQPSRRVRTMSTASARRLLDRFRAVSEAPVRPASFAPR